MPPEKLRNIDINLFRDDITKSPLIVDPSGNLEDYSDQYYDTLSGFLDKHAPKFTRIVSIRSIHPATMITYAMKKEKIDVVRENG